MALLTFDSTTSLVLVDVSAGSSKTVQLPPASERPGRIITIKDTGSCGFLGINTPSITVQCSSGDNFETNNSSFLIGSPLGFINIVADISIPGWRIIANSVLLAGINSAGTIGIGVASNANVGLLVNSNLSTIGQAAFYSSVQIQGGLSVFSSITAYGGLTVNGGIAFSQSTNAVAIGNSAGLSLSTNAIAIGFQAGQVGQSASTIAIGLNAGQSNQSASSVAIGSGAGNINQTQQSVGLGFSAGYSNQSTACVAVGAEAGRANQGAYGISIGAGAGYNTQTDYSIALGYQSAFQLQSTNSIAIGTWAAKNNQGANSIAIGKYAGSNNQGLNAIAIGNSAGFNNQAASSIILNASGSGLNATTSGFFINPVRFTTGSQNILSYNPTTSEIYYSDTLSVSSISTIGQASFYSTVQVQQALTVGGVTTISNRLGVTGVITQSNILNVTGLTTLSNTLNVAGVGGSSTGRFPAFICCGTTGGTSPTPVYTGPFRCSYDGINWITQLSYAGNKDAINSIAFNGTRFVAQCGTQFSYSSDGLNWTVTSPPTSFTATSVNGFLWNGSYWICAGGGTSSTANIRFSTNNGTSWVTSNVTGLFNSSSSRSFAYDGVSRYVAVGNKDSSGNTILYSSDTLTWNPTTGSSFNLFGSAVGYGKDSAGNPLWVAVGDDTSGNTIKYSTDGISWSNAISGSFTRANSGSAVYNGSRWVVASGGATGETVGIKYSDDGKNWSNATGSVGYSRGIAWNSNLLMWISAGSSSSYFFYSRNGIAWFQTTIATPFGDGNTSASSSVVVASFNQFDNVLTVAGGIWTQNKGISFHSTIGTNSMINNAPIYGIGMADLSLGGGVLSSLQLACSTGINFVGAAGDLSGNPPPSHMAIINGKIGIANTNPQYTLDVSGTINASGAITGLTKSFYIDHPVLSNYKLAHMSVEAARADLIYRNRKQLVGGNAQVDIETESTYNGSKMSPGTFDALATNAQVFLQNNDTFDRVKGYVSSHMLFITCENAESSVFVDWMVVAERHDPKLLSDMCSLTDSNGFLILEHCMSTNSVT